MARDVEAQAPASGGVSRHRLWSFRRPTPQARLLSNPPCPDPAPKRPQPPEFAA